MDEWLSGLAGGTVAGAFLWTLAALALLVIVLVVVRLLRGRGRGTFIAGGRNRLPRLAVVDAVAVDSQRRLVLVRRDDTEHLILIGGSNDVVVEPQIRMRETGTAQQRPRQNAPAPILPRRPAAPAPRPAAQAASEEPGIPPQNRAPVPENQRSASRVEKAPADREEPQMPKVEADLWAAPRARTEPEVPTREPARSDHAGKGGADETVPDPAVPDETPAPHRRSEASIEDEMSRLLDDLTEERDKKA